MVVVRLASARIRPFGSAALCFWLPCSCARPFRFRGLLAAASGFWVHPEPPCARFCLGRPRLPSWPADMHPSLRGEGRILRKRMEVQCVPSQAPGARSLLRWPPGESWAAPLARCRAGTPCSPPVGAHGASPPRLLCVHISVWNPRAVGGCAGAGAFWLLRMAPRCVVARAAHSSSCDLPPGPLWGWW